MRRLIAAGLVLVCGRVWADPGDMHDPRDSWAEMQRAASGSKENPQEKAKREAYLKENTFKISGQPVKTWVSGWRVVTADFRQRVKSKISTVSGQLVRLDPVFIYVKMKDGIERSVGRNGLTNADKTIVDRLEKQARAKPDAEK